MGLRCSICSLMHSSSVLVPRGGFGASCRRDVQYELPRRPQEPHEGNLLVDGDRCLSLAGIIPLSGILAEEEILAHAFHSETSIGTFALAMGLIAAFMTAFYTFRAVFKTFHGEFRGGGDKEREDIEATGAKKLLRD